MLLLLKRIQVAWLDRRSIRLTYGERRVVDDDRFSVLRPNTDEWNLQIRNISRDDQGQYRCTVYTHPLRIKIVTLHVTGKTQNLTFQKQSRTWSQIWRIRAPKGIKSSDFYCKRHICAWQHVVWAILRQNRSRGVTSMSVGGKSKKVTETPIGKTCRR